MKSFKLFFLLFSFTQLAKAQSIAEKIDNGFAPIANAWEAFVLYPISIFGIQVPIVLLLLVLGALTFTFLFKFVNIVHFPTAIRTLAGKYDEADPHSAIENSDLTLDGDVLHTAKDESVKGEVSHFQALATAVSGTVGLGNIAGVAVAVAVGGAGATFWMIVCGLIGMSTKFVECTLALKYREHNEKGEIFGGPMYYLKYGLEDINLKGLGKFLSNLFAILCVGASFGGGNAFQSNQAAIQLTSLFGIQTGMANFWIGVFMAIIVGVVIIGGIKRIAQVTEKMVPMMAIIYMGASLIVILSHFSQIPAAFMLIIKSAFCMKAGLGGLLGTVIVGFQRAAFSNEAGAGSAAIAHSAVRTKYPASEGIVALLEPFIDTVVICTMTALVIVLFNINGAFDYGTAEGGKVLIKSTGQWLGGVDLTSMAFSEVLPWFKYVLTIAVVLFAFSTMISWSYYGLQAWKFLFGKGKMADLIYKVMFVCFVIIGASTSLYSVIKFSDAMILALVFPNMIGLLLLFPKVRIELSIYLKAIRNIK